MFRFAGFEIDQQRATLRGPDGEAIKLRPKTYDMLRLFAANPGRLLSKQELMDAIWPNVRIGEDGLFQCIREIRAALGDDKRQIVKLVSGRGYVFEAEVTAVPNGGAAAAVTLASVSPESSLVGAPPPAMADLASTKPRWFSMRWPTALLLVAALGLVVGLAVATPIFAPNLPFRQASPSITVMPITVTDDDPQTAAMAASVTERLIDGLAMIDQVSVTVPRPATEAAAARPASAAQADYVVYADLRKRDRSWIVQGRLVKTATGAVLPIESASVDIDDADLPLQQSRLTAALGHPLSLRINGLMQAEERSSREGNVLPLGDAKAAIAQAIASITQTSRERFATAQTILETALAENPDNTDVSIALAALQLRGIQMVWYSPADAATAEKNAKATLERALRLRPNNIPALDAYCRFLMATNEFVETLVACARVMNFDPWNGTALYQAGIAQLQLGRFNDALASFKQADRYNTPRVSRWTWPLGIGMTYMLMGRNEEALPWLEKSIAITPATGRTHFLLAAAYQQLGRKQEAKAAMDKGLELRPRSSAANVRLPTKNSSSTFLEAAESVIRAMVEAGLPEQ